MKNNMLRRLALSAVTLGVCALSVTSATYAWFTTNTEATASNIEASTVETSGNLWIRTKSAAASETWGDWTNSATLAEEVSSVSLVPVAIKGETMSETLANNFTKNNSTVGTSDFTASIDSTDVLHYRMCFALSNLPTSGTEKVTIKLSNFTTTSGTQYLLAAAGTGATSGNYIKVELKDVLSMGVVSQLITHDKYSSYNITDQNSTDGTLTATNKYYRYKEESDSVDISTSSTGTFASATGNAHTYYDNIFGTTSISSNKSTYDSKYYSSTYFGDSSEIELFKFTGSTTAYVVTDFYFFIDGWDNQSFNACGGLSVTGGKMDFSLEQVETTKD